MTALRAAELRRLHTEVEWLKSMTAVTMGVGRGDGSLYVHGDYDSIKAAQALVIRAERLEEALEELRRKQRAVEHWNKLADDVERLADLGLLDTNVAKERAARTKEQA